MQFAWGPEKYTVCVESVNCFVCTGVKSTEKPLFLNIK